MSAGALRAAELVSLRDAIESRRVQLFRLAGLCERAGYTVTARNLRDAVSFTGQALAVLPTVKPADLHPTGQAASPKPGP